MGRAEVVLGKAFVRIMMMTASAFPSYRALCPPLCDAWPGAGLVRWILITTSVGNPEIGTQLQLPSRLVTNDDDRGSTSARGGVGQKD